MLFTKHSISVKVKWASIGFEYGWIYRLLHVNREIRELID